MPWNCNKGFSVLSCRDTKYLVLLSTPKTCVGRHVNFSILLPDFNYRFGISLQIFVEVSNIKSRNIKSHENPSSVSRADTRGPTAGRTDMVKLKAIFATYANTPKDY
jgi:hypothetical protein